MKSAPTAFGILSMLVLTPGVLLAGMPMMTLSDIARMRVENISFFLVLLLVSAFIVKIIWNHLQKDWAFLPRLTYAKALGLMVLWGLIFVLVLTMISGARELMTPGAWEKQGLTYRVAKESPAEQAQLDLSRWEKLDDLRIALWQYAQRHDGHFPPDRSTPEISQDRWQTPDPSGMLYVYVSGQVISEDPQPLVYEPAIYGDYRLVLFTNGKIRRISTGELAQAER